MCFKKSRNLVQTLVFSRTAKALKGSTLSQKQGSASDGKRWRKKFGLYERGAKSSNSYSV
jgi:hypothetical protein